MNDLKIRLITLADALLIIGVTRVLHLFVYLYFIFVM